MSTESSGTENDAQHRASASLLSYCQKHYPIEPKNEQEYSDISDGELQVLNPDGYKSKLIVCIKPMP